MAAGAQALAVSAAWDDGNAVALCCSAQWKDGMIFSQNTGCIIRPMVDRIVASRRPARHLEPHFRLIRPVEPQYGLT